MLIKRQKYQRRMLSVRCGGDGTQVAMGSRHKRARDWCGRHGGHQGTPFGPDHSHLPPITFSFCTVPSSNLHAHPHEVPAHLPRFSSKIQRLAKLIQWAGKACQLGTFPCWTDTHSVASKQAVVEYSWSMFFWQTEQQNITVHSPRAELSSRAINLWCLDLNNFPSEEEK